MRYSAGHNQHVFVVVILGQTHRTEPRQISSSKHPSTARNQEAREVLDTYWHGAAAATTQQDCVTDHSYRRTEHTGKEPPRVPIAKVACNAVDNGAPEEYWDGEILRLSDSKVEAEAEDDGY